GPSGTTSRRPAPASRGTWPTGCPPGPSTPPASPSAPACCSAWPSTGPTASGGSSPSAWAATCSRTAAATPSSRPWRRAATPPTRWRPTSPGWPTTPTPTGERSSPASRPPSASSPPRRAPRSAPRCWWSSAPATSPAPATPWSTPCPTPASSSSPAPTTSRPRRTSAPSTPPSGSWRANDAALGAGVRPGPAGAVLGPLETGGETGDVGIVLRVVVGQHVLELPGVRLEVVVLPEGDGGVVGAVVLDVLPVGRLERRPRRDAPVALVAVGCRPPVGPELQHFLRPGRAAGQERAAVERVLEDRRRVAEGVEVGGQEVLPADEAVVDEP